jgi:hypothetical protein
MSTPTSSQIEAVLTRDWMTTAQVNKLWRASLGDYGEPHGVAATQVALRFLVETGEAEKSANSSGARVWRRTDKS